MRRIAFAAAVLAMLGAALVTGGGPARAQEATPLPDIFMIGPTQCLVLANAQDATTASACQLTGPGQIQSKSTSWTGASFGIFDKNGDGQITREEVAGYDLDGNMVHRIDGQMAVVLFVSDDRPVRFEVTGGARLSYGPDPALSTNIECNPFAGGYSDPDCDNNAVKGDGLVFVQVSGANGALGPGQVIATDAYSHELLGTIDYTIVGEPHTLEQNALETVISEGLSGPDDCPLPGDVAGFTQALGDPHKAVVIARVKDTDGTDIASAWVHWESDNPDVANVSAPDTPTLDLGAFGFGAPQVVCGFDGTGTVHITATTSVGPGLAFDANGVDINGNPQGTNVLEITVRGAPAKVVVAADPPSLTCDGVQTTSVSATVTDAGGNPVASGTEVRFDAQTLGTANPIIATAGADGVAKTVITPLAVQNTGVPVVATAGSAAGSVLISCTGAVSPGGTTPPPGGAATATPVSGIVGPNTGTGGAAASAGGLTWWPLLGLLGAAIALAGTRALLGRATGTED